MSQEIVSSERRLAVRAPTKTSTYEHHVVQAIDVEPLGLEQLADHAVSMHHETIVLRERASSLGCRRRHDRQRRSHGLGRLADVALRRRGSQQRVSNLTHRTTGRHHWSERPHESAIHGRIEAYRGSGASDSLSIEPIVLDHVLD